MDKAKIDQVIWYFRSHRYDTEHHEDFDKHAQSFKIRREGAATLLAKISNEVLDDANADDLPHLLDRLELCEAMERLHDPANEGLLLTSEGIKQFTR